MGSLIQFLEEEKEPVYTRPEGKSKDWLADIEIHFVVDGKGCEIVHFDAEGSPAYLSQISDDLEVYDWASHIENSNPNLVYVLSCEWHGVWSEHHSDWGYEWDFESWVEKESILGNYDVEYDEGWIVAKGLKPRQGYNSDVK